MIEADRIISASPKKEEEVIDRAIRPKLLADYVGQAFGAGANEYFYSSC